MVGLLVAPTAPCLSSEYWIPPTAHESFQNSVAVVAAILCSGLLYVLAITQVKHMFQTMNRTLVLSVPVGYSSTPQGDSSVRHEPGRSPGHRDTHGRKGGSTVDRTCQRER